MGYGHVLVVECYFIHFCIGVFFLCCHYSAVCKKGGPSPYGSPSRNPMGGLAGMLVAPTVDARNLAEISINCTANCGLCCLQIAINLLQSKNIVKFM